MTFQLDPVHREGEAIRSYIMDFKDVDLGLNERLAMIIYTVLTIKQAKKLP
jgi:hypothetical protein